MFADYRVACEPWFFTYVAADWRIILYATIGIVTYSFCIAFVLPIALFVLETEEFELRIKVSAHAALNLQPVLFKC